MCYRQPPQVLLLRAVAHDLHHQIWTAFDFDVAIRLARCLGSQPDSTFLQRLVTDDEAMTVKLMQANPDILSLSLIDLPEAGAVPPWLGG